MSQELERQVIQPQEVATVQSVDLLAVVARAASDPSIDVGKLRAALEEFCDLLDEEVARLKAAGNRLHERVTA